MLINLFKIISFPENDLFFRLFSEKIGKTEIGLEDIKLAGLAQSRELVKVLGNGDINVAITVTADAFSASAVSKIEAAGGKANVIGE